MLARRAAAGPLERTHAAEGAHPGGRRRSAPPGHGRERFAPRRLRFSSIRGTTSTGALCPVPMASSDRSQSQPTRRQSLPSTESSRSAPHALRGGLRSHLRASLWASARSEGNAILDPCSRARGALGSRPNSKAVPRIGSAVFCHRSWLSRGAGAHTHLLHLPGLPLTRAPPTPRPQVADHVHDANEPADRAQARGRVGSLLHVMDTESAGRDAGRLATDGEARPGHAVCLLWSFYLFEARPSRHDG